MEHSSTQKAENASENGNIIAHELRAKRREFSEQELSALKGKADLVAQVHRGRVVAGFEAGSGQLARWSKDFIGQH